MKPLACRPSAARIGAGDGHERHHGRVFLEKAELLVGDEQRRQVPSAAPTIRPNPDCLARSRSAAGTETPPCRARLPRTAKVAMAPVASLKADSDITVCATRSLILTWRTPAPGSRIGRGDGRSEQQRHDERNAEEIVGRDAGDQRADQHPDGGEHDDGDPDSFSTLSRRLAPPSNRM
jgi:hypothetical protein